MKSFLTKIYTYTFFDNFILIFPLYAVMFQDSGITPFHISVLLGVWSVTAFLLEVPSGVWADKYSRKNILMIGQVFQALAYTIWIFFPTFIGFLIGFILWGINSALSSGTFQALLYDELKATGRQKDYTKILGTTKTLAFIAILSASALASLAILLGYTFVLAISVLSICISTGALLVLPRVPAQESTHEKEYFSLMKEGFTVAFKNIHVRKLIIFIIIVMSLSGGLEEFWGLFADNAGLPKYGLGIYLGIFSGIQAIASFIAYKFEKHSETFFHGLFTLNGIVLFGAAYFFNIPALALLMLFGFIFVGVQTVLEGKLQHIIPSETRATVSSVTTFFAELGNILIYLVVGLITQLSSYQVSFMTFGVLISLIGLWYLLSHKKKKIVSV